MSSERASPTRSPSAASVRTRRAVARAGEIAHSQCWRRSGGKPGATLFGFGVRPVQQCGDLVRDEPGGGADQAGELGTQDRGDGVGGHAWVVVVAPVVAQVVVLAGDGGELPGDGAGRAPLVELALCRGRRAVR
jgi:hypothetical protein